MTEDSKRLAFGKNKPTLQVTRYAGASPALAVCTSCGRQFKTPLTRLQKASDALASLQEQFERHSCGARSRSSHNK